MLVDGKVEARQRLSDVANDTQLAPIVSAFFFFFNINLFILIGG